MCMASKMKGISISQGGRATFDGSLPPVSSYLSDISTSVGTYIDCLVMNLKGYSCSTKS